MSSALVRMALAETKSWRKATELVNGGGLEGGRLAVPRLPFRHHLLLAVLKVLVLAGQLRVEWVARRQAVAGKSARVAAAPAAATAAHLALSV